MLLHLKVKVVKKRRKKISSRSHPLLLIQTSMMIFARPISNAPELRLTKSQTLPSSVIISISTMKMRLNLITPISTVVYLMKTILTGEGKVELMMKLCSQSMSFMKLSTTNKMPSLPNKMRKKNVSGLTKSIENSRLVPLIVTPEGLQYKVDNPREYSRIGSTPIMESCHPQVMSYHFSKLSRRRIQQLQQTCSSLEETLEELIKFSNKGKMNLQMTMLKSSNLCSEMTI